MKADSLHSSVWTLTSSTMEGEIVNRLQKFNLWRRKQGESSWKEGDIEFSKNECKRSLVGKIYGDKKVNFVGLHNTMTTIWTTKGDGKEPFSVCFLKSDYMR